MEEGGWRDREGREKRWKTKMKKQPIAVSQVECSSVHTASSVAWRVGVQGEETKERLGRLGGQEESQERGGGRGRGGGAEADPSSIRNCKRPAREASV